MVIDGKKLANEIKNSLRKGVLDSKLKLKLAIIAVGHNLVTEKFLAQKKKFAQSIGVSVRIYEFPENISTTALRKEISKIVHTNENTGIIVQLPLPKTIKTDYILDALLPKKDPDLLSSKSFGLFAAGRSKILPPVVGAVKSILAFGGAELTAKNAVVVGAGRLVGKPVALWLINQGAVVTVLNEHVVDLKPFTLGADIIISGAGKQNLISPEMVKEGAVAIDCGASEAEGKLVGDFNPEVSKKASLFSPVPGGVGPVAIAMLFSNLIELAKMNS